MKNFLTRIMGKKKNIVSRTAKGTILSLLLSNCVAFTACTDKVEIINQESKTILHLKVGVNQPTSRAIIEGKTLPNGSQMGVSVIDKTGTGYQNQNYNNILYTATVADSKQKWNTTANITLSGEEATLYAYYPYTPEADITAIPINMSEADQKDWMYATPVTGLSDNKATAEVNLNHALTNLRLTFYKDNYSGSGEVSEFTIQSTGLAVGGTLNAKTGEITLPATPVNNITRTATFTLTDKASATPIDVMLIPTGIEAPLTVNVTVDGHTYSASTAAFTMQKAKAYNYVMKLTSIGLELISLSLTDWNEVHLDDVTFEPGNSSTQEAYTDYFKLTYLVNNTSEPVDIFYYNYYPWDMVEYAIPLDLIERMIIEGVGDITPAHQYTFSTTGKHTIYVKFKDMTTIRTGLFYECDKLYSVIIPNGVQKIEDYAFYNCTGLTEKLIIPNSVQTIGDNAFWNCNELAALELGIGVQSIGEWAFSHCEGLTGTLVIPNSVTTIGRFAFGWCERLTGELVIPNSVTEIGFEAFRECTGLTRLNIGTGMGVITDSAFDGCSGLTEISLSNSVQTIGRYTFSGCTGLTSITIPNSVEKIDEGAFAGCSGLKDVTIPSSVTEIWFYAFKNCTELSNITSLATTAPNCLNWAFENVKKNGILYVPIGSTGYDTWMKNEFGYLGYCNWRKIEQ